MTSGSSVATSARKQRATLEAEAILRYMAEYQPWEFSEQVATLVMANKQPRWRDFADLPYNVTIAPNYNVVPCALTANINGTDSAHIIPVREGESEVRT